MAPVGAGIAEICVILVDVVVFTLVLTEKIIIRVGVIAIALVGSRGWAVVVVSRTAAATCRVVA